MLNFHKNINSDRELGVEGLLAPGIEFPSYKMQAEFV